VGVRVQGGHVEVRLEIRLDVNGQAKNSGHTAGQARLPVTRLDRHDFRSRK